MPLNASAAMSVRDEHPENIEVNVFVFVVVPNRLSRHFLESRAVLEATQYGGCIDIMGEKPFRYCRQGCASVESLAE